MGTLVEHQRRTERRLTCIITFQILMITLLLFSALVLGYAYYLEMKENDTLNSSDQCSLHWQTAVSRFSSIDPPGIKCYSTFLWNFTKQMYSFQMWCAWYITILLWNFTKQMYSFQMWYTSTWCITIYFFFICLVIWFCIHCMYDRWNIFLCSYEKVIAFQKEIIC